MVAQPFFRNVLINRVEIEDEIERLIALLDAYDGDCDMEDDDPAGSDAEDEAGGPRQRLRQGCVAVRVLTV